MALPSLFVFVHSSSLGDFSCWLPSLIVASAPKEQSLPAAGKTSVHYHSIAICHGYEEAKVKLHFYTTRPRGVANGQKERRRYYSIISLGPGSSSGQADEPSGRRRSSGCGSYPRWSSSPPPSPPPPCRPCSPIPL